MPKCSFCGENYDVPRGISYVLPNGEVLYFCSSKCLKNWKMGRRGDRQKWVIKNKKGKVEEFVDGKAEKKEEKVEGVGEGKKDSDKRKDNSEKEKK